MFQKNVSLDEISFWVGGEGPEHSDKAEMESSDIFQMECFKFSVSK